MLETLKDQPHRGLRPDALDRREQELLDTIRKIYAQQEEMYVNKSHTVKDRIVSIHQPYIRPMVRGKSRTDVEFGAKTSLSVVDRFLYLDHLRWNPLTKIMI